MGNLYTKKDKKSSQQSLLQISNNYESEKNTKEYFKLVKERLRTLYEENQNSQFNLSISLDKKDFYSMPTSTRISLHANQKFIHWKDYLITYLHKKSKKGHSWCSDLME
jgi:hypothetical protein